MLQKFFVAKIHICHYGKGKAMVKAANLKTYFTHSLHSRHRNGAKVTCFGFKSCFIVLA